MDFEQFLVAVEQSLQELKSRYQQIQTDQQQQLDLQAQQRELQQQLKQTPDPALRQELTKLKDQLEELEVKLESRLLSWLSFREKFWQIVRFLGLGMAIGWVFAFVTLKSPKPAPDATSPTTQSPQPHQ
ncbi:MAG: hypothetical protein KME16_21465 [Scytolyngbya sp. HA4215-MV1]|nr:hypothetical protein [Scytolyngbya sp. HA4215-MV1]